VTLDEATAQRSEAVIVMGTPSRMTPVPGTRIPPARKARYVAVATLAGLLPFCLESVIVATNMRWYGGLSKPSFAPPIWLAVPVWAALVVLLAWAFFRVLCRPDYLPDRPGAIRVFMIMLALGVVWCWACFYGRHPTMGLLMAALTAAAACLTAWRFAIVDRKAGLLLLPGFLAIIFAALIELSISVRNG